ncbi:MAG: septal ring lytic transglycosylase RlpA family protein [Proteobacteria bacterium]|nr:septal ring lytic transglycosylase RlpA family protein [Pseudomonadota bacterium]
MTKLHLYLGLAAFFTILGSCSLPQAVSYKVTHSLGKGAPQSAPPVFGKRKVGKPYMIPKADNGDDKWYYPMQSSEGYKKRGVASWYGRDFHGAKTSNGEIYNMYDYTAAHKELPLPTYARVTNTRNGKSIVVRINDRGPFAKDRLIDLSYASAKALDMVKQGTAPVTVEAISVRGGYGGLKKLKRPPSRPVKKIAYMPQDRIAEVPFTVRISNRKALANSKTKQKSIINIPNVSPSLSTDTYFIQFGAFEDMNNARKLVYRIKDTQNVTIKSTEINNTKYYRVVSKDIKGLKNAEKRLQYLQVSGFNNVILKKQN